MIVIASCKREKAVTPTTNTGTPKSVGLYEADSSIYKLLIIAVSKVGTQTVPAAAQGFVFDTGSGGMVIDANGILPASMISSTGFNFTGDSTVVNGITITKQTSVVQYGSGLATADKVYGNLAYASVTIGDANGSFVIKRLPFFIYYKAVDYKGNNYDADEFNTFGVAEEYDISFPDGAYITSPFSYFDPGPGLTRGFKMAAIGTSHFSYNGTYVPGVVTLGLTGADLASSSGFTTTQLYFYAGQGYPPIIPATINYNNKPFAAKVLFDTGTEPYSYIEDPSLSTDELLLPSNTYVTVATNSGFNYNYTVTASDNLTYIENPAVTGSNVSIIG
ncbi:MAG: hypothetical protein ABI203_11730, partial [Mucilaginibacter sp.]